MEFVEKLKKWLTEHEVGTDFIDSVLSNEELTRQFIEEFEHNPIEEVTDNKPIFSVEELNGMYSSLSDKLDLLLKALELVDNKPDNKEDYELW